MIQSCTQLLNVKVLRGSSGVPKVQGTCLMYHMPHSRPLFMITVFSLRNGAHLVAQLVALAHAGDGAGVHVQVGAADAGGRDLDDGVKLQGGARNQPSSSKWVLGAHCIAGCANCQAWVRPCSKRCSVHAAAKAAASHRVCDDRHMPIQVCAHVVLAWGAERTGAVSGCREDRGTVDCTLHHGCLQLLTGSLLCLCSWHASMVEQVK